MEVLENESRTRILKEFEIVRSTTMNLVKTLEADDYPVQTAPYTSPPKWHIGHTSWIYETVMSKINTEYEFYSKEYSKYLNSYYQQFGMPHWVIISLECFYKVHGGRSYDLKFF